ncbi:MATE family efflux transporter [Butyrivibrio sp. XPD2002]|uniref:MATE family efflux transporter n=1 Tax=Butyrivibrio sp. XPD2002 TaxID=1280665 RepID=UPI0004024615|nr:MATE family efflux transporter [Butyrivibrio sp. XPD2002]
MGNIFKDKAFYNKLIRLTLPIAFQSLMLAAVAAADAVMLGRIEQNQMAAVSLATQIQFVQNMVLTAATAAGAILGAQYYGRKDTDTINKVFGMMVRVVGIVSILTAAGCLLIPELLMNIFAHDPELIRIGASYLRIAGWSYFLTGICECYLVIMRVTNHVNRSALISTCAVVINIILNSVFIFGLFGIPAMGANGAALATLISRIIELAWAVTSAHQKGFLHPNYLYIFTFFASLEKDFIKIALPLLGGGLFWGVGFTSYTAIMGHLGADAAAANSVAAVVRDLFCCMCNGISSAGGIMVGNELGAGKLDKGKEYGIRLAKISYVIGFLSTALVLLVTFPVVNFMKLTPSAKSLLTGMMVVMAFYMIGRCVNTVIINGIFSAGGDTLFDVYSLAVCMWCLAIPTALLGAFVFHWPIVAVYACTCLDEVGKIPWVMYHFQKYKWVKDLTRKA